MSRVRWHMVRDGAALTLARPGRARLDVAARISLPLAARGRLAHQIRQDLWRELRALRGFSPVVRITRSNRGLDVLAGGQWDRAVPGIAARIEAVLNDPLRQQRWLAHARVRS
ncbi:hypothetical protein POI8812_02701 [Pontivivens insulae]|uniref:Uncharacterized protein n=1 Tax=Pontivivens insulae TaxID=1639689 RepID=A0A2R8AE77_9RHOB|nr:hypothetical protein [Pontivivens insulae]RED14288.1 hypothetical protein DFR53_1645 [Pontivivens insulae]SPF30365.1 hypothetical protein POI8812_02701 [Pontivivens insulae]